MVCLSQLGLGDTLAVGRGQDTTEHPTELGQPSPGMACPQSQQCQAESLADSEVLVLGVHVSLLGRVLSVLKSFS